MNKHAGRHVLQAMALQVLTLIVLLLIAVFPAMADDGISVTVDGKSLSFDVPPQLIQNRTMVPMRAIFEALGADVDWNGASSTVTATTVDSVVVMQIGNAEITVDGKKILLDVPPMLIDNRTLVPVRAVAEGLKSDVLWDEATKRVIITSKDSALRPVSLYLPNSNADGFDTKIAFTNGKADHIVSLLVSEKALPAGCALLDFALTGNGSCRADMNAAYGTALNTTGTAGEYLYLGTVVNTLLTYFKADTITITVEGKPLSTGHGGILDEPFQFYPNYTNYAPPLPGDDLDMDSLAKIIADLPNYDALSNLWSRVDGYWSSVYTDTGDDDLYFAFLRSDAVPGAEYGIYDSEGRGFGYIIEVKATGRFGISLQIRFLPVDATPTSGPLPNKIVTADIDFSDLYQGYSIKIRVEDQGNGGWYTYSYGHKYSGA